MNFNVSINCDNAAFDDDLTGIEICRILQSIEDKLQHIGYIEPQENMNGRIRDMNGNTVGSWELANLDMLSHFCCGKFFLITFK